MNISSILRAHRPWRMAMLGALLLAAPSGASRAEETAVWSDSLNSVPSMVSHASIYDPVGDRMIVIGGPDNVRKSTVWSMSMADHSWSELIAANDSLPILQGHSAIYDPLRHRVIVFGGYRSNSPTSEVWSILLDGRPRWEQLRPRGIAPGSRGEASAVYDAAEDRMVVFGGSVRPGNLLSYLNDAWALSLGAQPEWKRLETGALQPKGRYGHVAVYDSTFHRMVVHGGAIERSDDYGSIYVDETWELFLGPVPHWRFLTPRGAVPRARAYHGAAVDPLTNRMLIHAGTSMSSALSDSWSLDLSDTLSTSWIALPSASFGRWNYGLALDSARRRIVVHGGLPNERNRDVWAYSLDSQTWRNLAASDPLPSPRAGHYAVFDSTSASMIVTLGTSYGTGPDFPDTWSLTNEGWQQLLANSPLAGRKDMAVAWDPSRRYAWFFGGADYGRGPTSDELWWFDVDRAIFGRATPANRPPPMTRSSLVYDPLRDRLVLFGGVQGPATSARGEVWEISLSEGVHWTLVEINGDRPGVRYDAQAFYDTKRDRMIIMGGYDSSGVRNDVWALSPERVWTRIHADVPRLAGAALDPTRDRIVGFSNAVVYVFDLLTNSWSAPRRTGRGPTVVGGTIVRDPVRDRFIVFGGFDSARNLNETWMLRFVSDSTDTVRENTGSATRLEASVNDNRVRLRWRITGLVGPTTVERSSDGASWTLLGNPAAEGDSVVFEDSDVAPGRTYSYRLFDGSRRLDEVRVTIPLRVTREEIETKPDAVLLHWRVLGSTATSASIDRSIRVRADQDRLWIPLGNAPLTAEGDVFYTDTTVAAGHQYFYRLRDGQQSLDVVVVDVPPDSVVITPPQDSTTTPRPTLSFALGLPSPNPAHGAFTVTFVLEDGPPAILSVHDITGRRVHEKVFTMSPGPHTETISFPGPVVPGVYWVRLSQGRQVASSRAVLLR